VLHGVLARGIHATCFSGHRAGNTYGVCIGGHIYLVLFCLNLVLQSFSLKRKKNTPFIFAATYMHHEHRGSFFPIKEPATQAISIHPATRSLTTKAP
jgi:hypothetical protein